MMKLKNGLAKLTISAYAKLTDSHALQPGDLNRFEAQFNPASLHLGEAANYALHPGEQPALTHTAFTRLEPGELTLELSVSETGQSGVMPVLRQLHQMCFGVRAPHSEPCFLRVTWGQMRWLGRDCYVGRASSLTVSYTQFNRNGAPLGASATLSLVAALDESAAPAGAGGTHAGGRF